MNPGTQIKDIMTPGCESIGEHDSIRAAAEQMAWLGVGALPVHGDDRPLTGMLTDRDIAVRVIGAGKDPDTTEVAEVATPSTLVVAADDQVQRAIDLMSDCRVRRLPVVDGDENLVGMISQADIARNIDRELTGDLVASISVD